MFLTLTVWLTLFLLTVVQTAHTEFIEPMAQCIAHLRSCRHRAYHDIQSSCTGSTTSSLITLPNNCVSVGLPCVGVFQVCGCAFVCLAGEFEVSWGLLSLYKSLSVGIETQTFQNERHRVFCVCMYPLVHAHSHNLDNTKKKVYFKANSIAATGIVM